MQKNKKKLDEFLLVKNLNNYERQFLMVDGENIGQLYIILNY